jgi:PAS domain S-box-containing protein
MLSTYTEVYNRLADINDQYEPIQFDELLWIIVFLTLAFSNFSWHRYRELQDEIDERKKMENSLRESEAKYAALVENSKDAIVIVQNDVFRFVNKGFLEMVNAKPEEIVGTHFKQWVSPESYATFRKRHDEQMVPTGAPRMYEIVLKKKDGTKIPTEINSTDIEFDGRDADLVVIRNISERKSMEAKLARYTNELESLVKEKTKEVEDSYSRLQKVDKMRSEFIDVAAHELRTPLTSIKAYIDLMRDGHIGRFTDEDRPTLGDMTSNIEGLNRLINDMLDYTKTEDRLLELSFEEVPVADMAQKVVDGFVGIAKAKSISLNFDSKGDTRAQVDTGMMKKVFINLIGNALKYSRQGGSVNVHVQEEKDHIKVSVADTGVGIKKEELPFIFERFYMGDTSLTREKDQLGFGLSIAESIVERHGGKIWAESRVGKGSKFHFTLPK